MTKKIVCLSMWFQTLTKKNIAIANITCLALSTPHLISNFLNYPYASHNFPNYKLFENPTGVRERVGEGEEENGGRRVRREGTF